MRFYLDGELVGTDNFPGGVETLSGGHFYIGRSNWPGDETFQGAIADTPDMERRSVSRRRPDLSR
jgi:hypothetical protein